MLAVVASMIGCPIPPTAVLAKYIDMLTEYPPDLIEEAGTAVLKKHKWNTFPKVAEFIEPILEEFYERRNYYRQTQRLYYSYMGEHPPPLIDQSPRRGLKSIGQAIPEIKKDTSHD